LDLVEAIKNRRSIRSFKGDVVSEEDIYKLLEAASYAPTAGNVQPWIFIVVKNIKTKKNLAVSALNQLWMTEAPVVIVVCANLARAKRFYGERGRDLYSIQDTAAAAQNILLTAVSLGLGGCWVGAFSEARVAKILDLSLELRPLALIPVGYPNEEPQPSSRFKLEEAVSYVE